jgi:hypothetical protein
MMSLENVPDDQWVQDGKVWDETPPQDDDDGDEEEDIPENTL